MEHPMQPMYLDEHKTVRFKGNGIIEYLFESGKLSLNDLAAMGCFSKEDWTQLAQLLGYSVGGFGDLSYVSKETVATADEMASKVYDGEEVGHPLEEENKVLKAKLKEIRELFAEPVGELYNIHPDDLRE